MDSSNITTTTTTADNSTLNYHEIPLSSFLNLPQPPPPPLPPPPPSSSSPSPSPSFFDPLPSYLPTFHHEPSPSPSSSSQPPSQPPPPCSNKKRTRASRRAPTTVLTTDTSNFRAMVQEFTGFPAPPFSSSLPRPPRFDPLSRPFPQKLPTPSSLVDAIVAATAANAAAAAAYPFPNAATMIGIQNHNNILAPPPPPPPTQFATHVQPQQHIRPSWADPQDRDDQFQQQEKRQRTSGAEDGVVESWIQSSD